MKSNLRELLDNILNEGLEVAFNTNVGKERHRLRYSKSSSHKGRILPPGDNILRPSKPKLITDIDKYTNAKDYLNYLDNHIKDMLSSYLNLSSSINIKIKDYLTELGNISHKSRLQSLSLSDKKSSNSLNTAIVTINKQKLDSKSIEEITKLLDDYVETLNLKKILTKAKWFKLVRLINALNEVIEMSNPVLDPSNSQDGLYLDDPIDKIQAVLILSKTKVRKAMSEVRLAIRYYLDNDVFAPKPLSPTHYDRKQ